MNPLLKRQLRKYLKSELHDNEDLNPFLEAISKSYDNYDNQFVMLQRATVISSDELFFANKQLKKESDSQKEVIKKLKSVIDTLKFYGLNTAEKIETTDFDPSKLIDFIDNQTKEIVKINKQKDILLKDLEKQNEELNDYAHMVSHDLRSPLQSIDALIDWLHDEHKAVLNQSGNEKIELIKNNIEKIDTLVRGILQYSTIGKLEKNFYPIDLDELVKTVLCNLSIPKNIAVSIAKKLPVVKGDAYRLEQLFEIFISNAIKFNDKEKGIVEIDYDHSADYWEFYIKDNGVGIAEQYLNKIFVAFQKLQNDYKATGIGLSIAKKIIEVYQGVIRVKSKPNQGSTFYFSIKKQL